MDKFRNPLENLIQPNQQSLRSNPMEAFITNPEDHTEKQITSHQQQQQSQEALLFNSLQRAQLELMQQQQQQQQHQQQQHSGFQQPASFRPDQQSFQTDLQTATVFASNPGFYNSPGFEDSRPVPLPPPQQPPMQQQQQHKPLFPSFTDESLVRDSFDLSSLALPGHIQGERFIQQRRHSGSQLQPPPSAAKDLQRQTSYGSYGSSNDSGQSMLLDRRVRQLSESSVGSSYGGGSGYGSGLQGTSSSSACSSLFGLSDISSRLEATLNGGTSSGWSPLCGGGNILGSGPGSLETIAKSPSPPIKKMNPIEEFVFLSDDDDRIRAKESSPLKAMLFKSPEKMASVVDMCAGKPQQVNQSCPLVVPDATEKPHIATTVTAAAIQPPPPAVLKRAHTEPATPTVVSPHVQGSATAAPSRVLQRTTSWSQVVRKAPTPPAAVTANVPKTAPVAAVQTFANVQPAVSAQIDRRSASSSPTTTAATATARGGSPTGHSLPIVEFHRGPKVDPRWPVDQQLFLGPIPVAVTWDEIRNTFYNKVARHQILHTYVQSKPVNDVVYGQIVFDKAAMATKILKEGPIKVGKKTLF